MVRNVISLYLFVAVLLTAYFATYVLSKGKSGHMKVFSVFSFCVSLYLFGYLLEINSTVLEDMIFWNQVQYFGIPFISALWLLLTLLYVKKFNILQERTMVLFLVVPVLTFFVRLTNSLHYLYYSSFEVQQAFAFPLLYLHKGPWYHVQGVFVIVAQIFIIIVLSQAYRKSIRVDHLRVLILLAASVTPFIGFFLNIIDFKGLGLDYTALLLPVSLFLILLAVVKFDFLEVKALARETMFENSADAMILFDKDLRILDYNKSAETFFASLEIFLPKYGAVGSEDDTQLAEIFGSETVQDFRCMLEGQERFFEIKPTVIRDIYDRNIGRLISVHDITERKMMQDKLRILATIDSLSGLNNREQFMQLAQNEFERARRYNQVFSVLMMDLDNFKSVNDSEGHAAGDAVIREVGRLMLTGFRQTDICGRIGGEEFVVVLTNTRIDCAWQAAEKFRQTVQKTKVVYGAKEISMTVSIGVASYGNKAESIEEIIRCADKGLYECKAAGRNCTKQWLGHPA